MCPAFCVSARAAVRRERCSGQITRQRVETTTSLSVPDSAPQTWPVRPRSWRTSPPGLGRGTRVNHLGGRLEADECIGAEVGQPNGVALVDEDRVRHRARAGQAPLAPAARVRIVHAELAGVPLADPDPAAGVRPRPARALVLRRRLSTRTVPRLTRCGRGSRRRATRTRRSGRRRGDAVRARARGAENTRAWPSRGSSRRRSPLPREPEDAAGGRTLPCSGSRSPAAGSEVAAYPARRWINPDDHVEPAVGDPRCAVRPDDHSVRRGARSKRSHAGSCRFSGVEPAELPGGLGRVPDAAVPSGSHVVRVLARSARGTREL